jgi:hypothetical protein
MADTANLVLRVIQNNYRNVTLRCSLVSDGSGLANYKIFDATSAGSFGVKAPGGQTVYPGIHTKVLALDYDVQDMKMRLQWDATTPEDIMALGSAPEDFNWNRIGGIPVPSGLAGATGSILLTTVGQSANSTFAFILYLRKNVPQS